MRSTYYPEVCTKPGTHYTSSTVFQGAAFKYVCKYEARTFPIVENFGKGFNLAL